MRTVILDLDGTLADTSADLAAAANACFRGLGLPDLIDADVDRATAFGGGRALLRLGFARAGGDWREDEVDRQYPRLLAHYRDGIDRHTRLYPGAAEAVGALRDEGIAVGICTNKPADLAELLLARLGVRDLFHSLVGAGTLPVRKPDPAPYRLAVDRAGGALSRSFLLGDTETDVATARAAGVQVALVSFGPEGTGVARLSPDAMLAAYTDLPALASRLLGPA